MDFGSSLEAFKKEIWKESSEKKKSEEKLLHSKKENREQPKVVAQNFHNVTYFSENVSKFFKINTLQNTMRLIFYL